jgi:hypothetical protein
MVWRGGLTDTGWVSVVPPGRLALLTGEPVQLNVAELDGSGLVSLASTGLLYGGSVAWLAGTEGVVYTGGPFPLNVGLHVHDLSGGSRLLTASGTNPRASRDGAWVYFEDAGGIWRIHPDGSGRESIVPAGVPPPFDADPSPDGGTLVLARSHSPQDGTFDVWLRELDTGEERLLQQSAFRPRWSPDGTHVAFLREYYFTPTSLSVAVHLVAADGSDTRQVSPPGRRYAAGSLDWSPDGEWLVVRGEGTQEVIQVATGLALPLPYTANHPYAAWKW